MKASRRLLLGIGMAMVFFAGVGFHKTVTQAAQKLMPWMEEEAKLPPDVHPETLSRMERSKESDFTTDEEKEAFKRANRAGNGEGGPQRWLGPTATRMADPLYAEAVERINRTIHRKDGVDPKYMELTVAVVTRESGNREEFLNHQDDAIKAYGQELEDIIRLHKDTKGVEPKAAAIIEFGRELFKQPRTAPISSKAFADLQNNFGKRGALSIAALMCYYDTNYMFMRIYDQHMDTSADCKGGHRGCLDLKNPPPAW